MKRLIIAMTLSLSVPLAMAQSTKRDEHFGGSPIAGCALSPASGQRAKALDWYGFDDPRFPVDEHKAFIAAKEDNRKLREALAIMTALWESRNKEIKVLYGSPYDGKTYEVKVTTGPAPVLPYVTEDCSTYVEGGGNIEVKEHVSN